MSVNASECINESQASLWRLFWTFLKIGSTAFGGFMALISVVQNYLVDREKLLTDEDMLDGISLATILPGPVAVNVVAYAGYKIRGIWGAVICASAVTIPSFFLILFLSYAYFEWGNIPAVSSLFQGFLPAVAAIILATSIKMGSKALTGFTEICIALSAIAMLMLVGGFYSTLIVIAFSGLAGFLFFKREATAESSKGDEQKVSEASSEKKKYPKSLAALAAMFLAAVSTPLIYGNTFMAGKLLATFAGMSVLLFGGGFVFIPLMQESVVDSYNWVTQQEFIDAIAMGQITPGPILVSATFIGYKVAGVFGATMATIGIFTPPAMIMLICTHFLEKVKSSQVLKVVLKGIRCGVIGMIAAASYFVAMSAEINAVTISIFVASMIALLKFKLEVVWIIPVSGLIGLLAFS